MFACGLTHRTTFRDYGDRNVLRYEKGSLWRGLDSCQKEGHPDCLVKINRERNKDVKFRLQMVVVAYGELG